MFGEGCIPEGEYEIRLTNSPHFGRVYEVMNVPDRTHILIHKGNFCCARGHTEYVTDSYGCILPGETFSRLMNKLGNAQRIVTYSGNAFARLMLEMAERPGILTVKRGPLDERFATE